ncbi:tRNA 2-thiouridine synthesizing protein B [Marinobacter pelagius]|uniref:tRNA 2-thiouridine synthesizing protein B n=1 Tax=Marinobacter pelagius TaxID=379482 RepID=A0A366G518_9GAMM|nr:sulfurtransferase complex subunit TusB [Marinobacter pelagius]RBP21988.1 tRNA 2-thiouridine synthesizing protein B [Marinobacter pelagius]
MTEIQTLHILNKSPEHPRFARCLSIAGPADTILLIENGVLGLSTASASASGKVLALEPDMAARGIVSQSGTVETVDYDAMVALTARAQQVISW